MRLALAMGVPRVSDLLRQMSSYDLAEWMAYEALDPWADSPQRKDYRTAALASLIANTHRDRKRRSQPFGPQDFLALMQLPPEAIEPEQPIEKPARPWQAMLEIVEMWNAALGGEDKRPPSSDVLYRRSPRSGGSEEAQ